MKTHPNVGVILKEFRERGDLPRKTLAAAIDYDVSYIAGVESGTKNGSAKFFQKCAVALKIPVSRFISEQPEDLISPIAGDDFHHFIAALNEAPLKETEHATSAPDAAALQRVAAECLDADALATRLHALLIDEQRYGVDGRAVALWTTRHYSPDGPAYRTLYKALPQFLRHGGQFTHVWRDGKDKNGSPRKNIANQVSTILEMLKCVIRYSEYDSYRCVLNPHMIIRSIPTDLYLTGHSGFIITLAGWLESEPEQGFYSPGPNKITAQYGDFLDKNAYPVVRYFRTDQAEKFYQSNAKTESSHRDRFMVQRLFANILRPVSDFEEGGRWWLRTAARTVHRKYVPVEKLAPIRRESVQEFERTVLRKEVRQIASYDALRHWAVTGVRNDIVLMGTPEEGRLESKAERSDRLRHIQSLLNAYENLEIALVDEATFASFIGAWPQSPGYELSWVVHESDAVVLEVSDTRDPGPEKLWRILINNSESASVFMQKFSASWDSLPPRDRDRRATQEKLAALQSVVEKSAG